MNQSISGSPAFQMNVRRRQLSQVAASATLRHRDHQTPVPERPSQPGDRVSQLATRHSRYSASHKQNWTADVASLPRPSTFIGAYRLQISSSTAPELYH